MGRKVNSRLIMAGKKPADQKICGLSGLSIGRLDQSSALGN
jgi:hypothetical protein